MSEKMKSSFLAISRIFFPSLSDKNSPSLFNNFNAFHCFGLWLAVKIIPPAAFSFFTATSTVGVVDKPISTTSNPQPIKVPVTILETNNPEILASLPTTIFLESFP